MDDIRTPSLEPDPVPYEVPVVEVTWIHHGVKRQSVLMCGTARGCRWEPGAPRKESFVESILLLVGAEAGRDCDWDAVVVGNLQRILGGCPNIRVRSRQSYGH